jgi:xylulokinase
LSFLTVDIGSSQVKAGLIAEDGRLIALAKRPVRLFHGPGPNDHEVDSDEWITASFDAMREVMQGQGRPRALAVSGNGPTLVALDRDNRPVGRALSWMDRRASSEAALVSRHAGMPIDASFYLPKALWFATRHAQAARIARFLSCPEHLLLELTGEAWTYLPDPGYLPYIWSDALIAACGLERSLFPPFIAPGRACGNLRREAAEHLGLPIGIPAIAGFPDFLAGLVGAGIVEEGEAGDRGGTSEALNIAARSPFPGRGLLSLPHAIPGLWNLSGGLSTAGKALEWLAANLGVEGPEALLALAESSEAGARGLVFLPYLAGERAPLWDPDRRAAFSGLSLAHGRPELARAACEALCYALRLPAELARDAGFRIDLVRTTGGSGSAPFMAGLKASILGIPVELPEVCDSELVGDAAAAALGLGDFADLRSASKAMSHVARRHEPDPALASRYGESYSLWKEALGALSHVDAHGAAMRFGRGEDA